MNKSENVLDDVLDVTQHPSEPGWFIVAPILSDDVVRDKVRSYPSKAAAWHHACWSRFPGGLTPRLSSGRNCFEQRGGGFGSDPRFAQTVDIVYTAGPSEYRATAERLVTRFIRARIGDMGDMEPLHPIEEQPTDLEGVGELQNGAAESQTGDDGATTPDGVHDARRAALSDSLRNAYDNFSHMIETAPSDAARFFWSEELLAVIEGRWQ